MLTVTEGNDETQRRRIGMIRYSGKRASEKRTQAVRSACPKLSRGKVKGGREGRPASPAACLQLMCYSPARVNREAS